MKRQKMARALRDPEFRNRLSASEQTDLPEHPAGIAQLDDSVLQSVTGGCFLTTPATSCVPPGTQCP